MGRAGILVWTGIFTGIVAGICAGIHGVLAFGEAFGSAIDQHRVGAFVFLTACFPFAASWLALRKSKDEKNA
ncbi:hypothetical protein Oter_3046 [Opitutus terrae PB90-1]|uniref:Uncharacterized protein n=2 Tax=Opitutus terrae TaxID=107709 RepID=B1ZZ03_OPITP|nr:hypothetical protein Oter_3046 [Opitutus terrae PB90-1]